MVCTPMCIKRLCNEFRLLRLPEVLRITALSKSRLYVLQKRGLFPPSVDIGPRAVAWRECDVWAWVESRPRTSETDRR